MGFDVASSPSSKLYSSDFSSLDLLSPQRFPPLRILSGSSTLDNTHSRGSTIPVTTAWASWGNFSLGIVNVVLVWKSMQPIRNFFPDVGVQTAFSVTGQLLVTLEIVYVLLINFGYDVKVILPV